MTCDSRVRIYVHKSEVDQIRVMNSPIYLSRISVSSYRVVSRVKSPCLRHNRIDCKAGGLRLYEKRNGKKCRIIGNDVIMREASLLLYFALSDITSDTLLCISINEKGQLKMAYAELMAFAKLAIISGIEQNKCYFRRHGALPLLRNKLRANVGPPFTSGTATVTLRLQSILAVIIATKKNSINHNGKVFRRHDGNTDP